MFFDLTRKKNLALGKGGGGCRPLPSSLPCPPFFATLTCDIESIENGQKRPGEWKNEKNIFEPLEQQRGNRCSNAAI